MKLLVNLSWDPSTTLQEATLINLYLVLENGETTEYKGQLKKYSAVMDYLWHLYVNATGNYGKSKGYIGKQIKFAPKKGIKIYSIPVTVSEDKEIAYLKYKLERIEKKHFLVTRNVEVSNQEYCIFFGSSGGLWNPEDCDYKRGDFVETLRQTVYGMENGSPDIYKWTNVPCQFDVIELAKKDAKFAQFAEDELFPLIKNFWSGAVKNSGNVDAIKKQFILIADVAEQYKKENNLESI